MTRLRIVFLLPGSGHDPVGGFKVVYEYAQGLAARGHQVVVAHAASVRVDLPTSRALKARLGWVRRRLTGYRPDRWFRFRHPVELRWCARFSPHLLRAVDVTIATSWETAEWLASVPAPAPARRIYLIQHLETWSGNPARVRDTWRLPLEKVVIARWLADVAAELGEDAIYIPNGFDLDAFGIDVPIEGRIPTSVAALWHPAGWKGCDVAIEALSRARSVVPELEATFFGVPAPPAGLPDWCRYVRNPSQPALRALYNHAALFLSASRSEGWGLTGGEAMLSGAAFVGTDIGGHREYARHGDTALLAPPDDPAALATHLTRLAGHPEERILLATRGAAAIRAFTWDRAVSLFAQLLETRRGDPR